ncbi:MAG TPA: ATP-dependent DNA helicase RecG [Longimicrobiaceae bacterium]|nr:ATP-dependent DNA helicase RecG [Longimicrobiaceae bacterium]
MSPGRLDSQAQFLKGVGPRRADLLRKLGLITARDVLYHVPHRYEDASTVRPIGSLVTGMEATIIGRVVSKGVLPTRKGLRIFQAVVKDATGVVECSWPGQPFLDRIVRKGDLLLLWGGVRFFHGIRFHPREFTLLARAGEESPEEGGTVFPVYPATEGLSHRQVRTLLADNLDRLLEGAAEEEFLSAGLLDRLGLPTLVSAFEMLHRPTSLANAERGRRRLAFEELLFLQLLHARIRHQTTIAKPGIAFQRNDTLVRPLYDSLPFRLTAAQRRVLREIGADMSSRRRMNRLLQGDVGAGKTVVALFAMLRAVENGRQAALMAPTEVLAEQHMRMLQTLLKSVPVEIQLLTGRLGAAERRSALASISSGAAGIVVGTHALIQAGVQFHSLGVAVIDEQHRFGVRQRMALSEMGGNPDVIVMSATPIPRSLALTLHGELDISILDERPPGRQPVRTALRPPSAAPRVFEFVREQVLAGRQAYLVYPLVEESEKMDLKSATEEYERLRTEVFPDSRLGLLHGQMPGEEKDRVMRAFAAGGLDILVATTVIEVGIDVANATVMVVEHAERFGLSQLHQLRGRVGRGAEESFCILLAPPDSAERLRVITSTEDGFAVAAADLRLRGQGDLFGDRQSGIPAFKFADLEKDEDLLLQAREVAREMIAEDPELSSHPRIRLAIEERYGDRARMFHAG